MRARSRATRSSATGSVAPVSRDDRALLGAPSLICWLSEWSGSGIRQHRQPGPRARDAGTQRRSLRSGVSLLRCRSCAGAAPRPPRPRTKVVAPIFVAVVDEEAQVIHVANPHDLRAAAARGDRGDRGRHLLPHLGCRLCAFAAERLRAARRRVIRPAHGAAGPCGTCAPLLPRVRVRRVNRLQGRRSTRPRTRWQCGRAGSRCTMATRETCGKTGAPWLPGLRAAHGGRPQSGPARHCAAGARSRGRHARQRVCVCQRACACSPCNH